MNKKMNIIKKSLLSVCNKFKAANVSDNSAKSRSIEIEQPVYVQKRFALKETNNKTRKLSMNKYNKTRRMIKASKLVNSNHYETILTNVKSVQVATSSSGYGTSIESAFSVFVNLDNYFYDENFAKIKDKAQENVKSMKTDVVQYLLEYQVEFINLLKNGLEKYIRPLSAIMESKLFLETFQNIEKIYAMSEFIRNSINESMHLTMDIYTSTLTVIHEFIALIFTTYETYLKGFAQSESLINDHKFEQYIQSLNVEYFLSGFEIVEFIDLPIKNITKIYCAFMSLLEMTPASELHDYERISTICHQIKQLIGPSSDTSIISDLSAVQHEIENNYIDINSFLDENSVKKNQVSLTPSDLKYNFVCSLSESTERIAIQNNSKKIYKSKLSKKSLASSKRLSLPKDYTDKDGYKYYFL